MSEAPTPTSRKFRARMDVVLFAEDIDHALYILALAMSEKAVLGIDAPIRYFGDLVVEPVESGLEESL